MARECYAKPQEEASGLDPEAVHMRKVTSIDLFIEEPPIGDWY